MTLLLTRFYLVFSILLLVITATAKILSDHGDPRLNYPDPFLSFISSGTLMIIISIVELIAAFLVCKALFRSPRRGVLIVLWLFGLFALYRIGFQFSPEKADTCKCFGVGSFLGKMEHWADFLSILLLTVLLVTGAILTQLWRAHSIRIQARNTAPSIGAVAALLLLHPTTSAQETFAPAYEAQGLVDEKVYSSSGVVASTREFPISVSVDSKGRWKLTWIAYHSHWDMTITEHIAYNGTDIYSVVYSDKALDAKYQPVSNLPLEKKQHPARICRGPYPVDHSSLVGLVWMVFCGGDHLQRHPNSRVPDLLVTTARTEPAAWCTDLEFTTNNNGAISLLSSGKFILNPNRVFLDLMEYPELDEPGMPERVQATQRDLKAFKTVSDSNRLRSSFALEETTVREGLHVPTKFSAIRYSPPSSTSGQFIHVTWNAKITNILVTPHPDTLLPPIIGTITVEDRRFMHRTKTHYVNNWFYRLDGKQWITSTNDSFFRGTNQVRLNVRQSARTRGFLFVAAVVLFLGMSLLPVIIWIKNRVRSA